MRIFEHNFVADKAKIRRRAAARQGFLTQYAAKFAEKTFAYAYEDRFLYMLYYFLNLNVPSRSLSELACPESSSEAAALSSEVAELV